MSESAEAPQIEQISTVADLQDDGILWMINTTIFHPRGLTLGFDKTTGKFYVQSDGSEVWIFQEELAEEKFGAWNALLERHMAKVPKRS